MKVYYILTVLVVLVITAVGCGSTSDEVYMTETVSPEAELSQVQFQVLVLMNHLDNQISNLQEDSRIDWDNCANSLSEATKNMTGELIGGSKPLIAVAEGADSLNLSLSNYLYMDRTEHRYWIEPNGTVHQVKN